MGTNSTKLLIKSYKTWTIIKHGILKSYYLEEKQLSINESLK